jgi:hypothetical protein
LNVTQHQDQVFLLGVEIWQNSRMQILYKCFAQILNELVSALQGCASLRMQTLCRLLASALIYKLTSENGELMQTLYTLATSAFRHNQTSESRQWMGIGHNLEACPKGTANNLILSRFPKGVKFLNRQSHCVCTIGFTALVFSTQIATVFLWSL